MKFEKMIIMFYLIMTIITFICFKINNPGLPAGELLSQYFNGVKKIEIKN